MVTPVLANWHPLFYQQSAGSGQLLDTTSTDGPAGNVSPGAEFLT